VLRGGALAEGGGARGGAIDNAALRVAREAFERVLFCAVHWKLLGDVLTFFKKDGSNKASFEVPGFDMSNTL
jgi:hypothetical protein